MAGVIGCHVSNFLTVVCLVHCLQVDFVLGQRDIATVHDEDHARLVVDEILGAQKKGAAPVVHSCLIMAASLVFLSIWCPELRSKQ